MGNVAYDRERAPFLQSNLPMQQERSYSEETAHAVDGEVHSLVERAFARAVAILERNRALLDRTAEALLKTETLESAGDRAAETRDFRRAVRFQGAPALTELTDP